MVCFSHHVWASITKPGRWTAISIFLDNGSYSSMAITVQNASVHTLLGQTFSEIKCFYTWQNVCIGLCDAVVSAVAFRAKGRGFKSTHGCSHTMKKPSISPRLFGQCTLNIYLHFTINPILRPSQDVLAFPFPGDSYWAPIKSHFFVSL